MPHYWHMNNSYCKEWDIIFNKLLDKYEFNIIDDYTAKLGSNLIWISNIPYSSFMLREHVNKENIRPSRNTIYKANKRLQLKIKETKSDLFKNVKF